MWWNVSLMISIGLSSKSTGSLLYLPISFAVTDNHFHFFFQKLIFRFSGKKLPSINLGSYNYLGFAENSGPCSDEAIKSIEKYGVATCSTRYELGTQQYQNELERLMAEYLNVEDCIAFGMGFATNSLNIPTLVGKVKKSTFFLFLKKCRNQTLFPLFWRVILFSVIDWIMSLSSWVHDYLALSFVLLITMVSKI